MTLKITKGDAMLRLLTEIKLALKEMRESMEQIEKRLEKVEKQTSLKKEPQNSPKFLSKKDWRYPTKMK